jgi:hypothetical protein
VSRDQRELLRELGGELASLVRGHTSRSAQEREAAARRWAVLKERAEASPSEDFRADLNGILSGAVDRLQALHDEVLGPDDKADRDAPR